MLLIDNPTVEAQRALSANWDNAIKWVPTNCGWYYL
jgi:hypothetical protein